MVTLKQTKTDFMKDVYIGTRAFFIEIDSKGYEEKIENLAQSAGSFSTCVIYGEEPFNYKSEIAKLCTEIQKLNPYTMMVIYTSGYIRPSGMTSVKNVKYIIEGKLKKSGINYSDRVNENSFQWFGKAGAYFVFDVYDNDDLDEIQTLIAALMINKSQVYVNINTEHFEEIAMMSLNFGFNIYVKFDGVWWNDANTED